VRSIIRTKLFPEVDTDPAISTESVFHTEVSSADMESDKDLSVLYHNPELTLWMGPGRHVVGSPVPKKELYSAAFCDHLLDDADKDGIWVKPGDLEVVRSNFSNFDPTLQKVLAKAQCCIKWTTATGAPLARWTSNSGKIVLLGDAAHAMLPDAAQVRYLSQRLYIY
jgi:salicylate hydroxylase